MGIQGLEGGGRQFAVRFADTFKKDLAVARKKAGAVIGRKVVKERIAALVAANKERIGGGIRTSGNFRQRKERGTGGISRRRKQAVRSITGRDGTLVVMDHAPMAVIQETGGTISGSQLYVHDRRRRPQPGEKVFVRKNLVFAAKPWRKKPKNGPAPKQPVPRLVGTFRTSVRIKQLPAHVRLANAGRKYLPEYVELVEKHLGGK